MFLKKFLLKKRVESAKEFFDFEEAQKFCELYYSDYVKRLDDALIRKIMRIESAGRNCMYDGEVIDAIKRALKMFPSIPFDIIVYRGGDLWISDRPFLSGSFLKDIAVGFAKGDESDLHRILLRKGAKIIPIYSLNHLVINHGDPEMELILDMRKRKTLFRLLEI